MKKIVVFLLCMVFVVPSVDAAWWSGNAGDRNISYDSYPDSMSSSNPRITVGPEGNLYCIWSGGLAGGILEMHFGKSTDNGVTWSSYTRDIMISADDGQSVVAGYHAWAITTNSMGDIFVVWSEPLAENLEIMLLKSTDHGDTWIHGDTDFNVSFAGSTVNAFDPEIAIDNNDNIYVVWSQYIAAADSSEIHISISTDNGDTWSGRAADRAISFYNAFNAYCPSIAITPNNDIYVVWCELIAPGWESIWRIMYGKSTDGGATFNSETADNPISLEVIASWPPQAVADNFGNVHVLFAACYEMFPLEELFYTGTTDGGATWSGNSGMRNIDFGVGDNNFVAKPALAVTSAGKLIAVWSENRGSPYYTFAIFASYSHDGGLTWTGTTGPEVVDSTELGMHAHTPDVIAGVGDTLYVVWNEDLHPSIPDPCFDDILISKGDTLALGPDGRCCYNANQNCADTTEAACLALGGNWNPDLNCIDNPCPTGGGCEYVVGDVNGSDSYNGLDITYGVNYFKGGSDPLCPDCTVGDCNSWHYCGDVNGSCSYNGLDITYGVSYFKGGAAPIYCVDCPPQE